MAETSSSWLPALEKPVNEVIREQENENKNILNDGPKHELERKFEISDQSSLKFSPLKTAWAWAQVALQNYKQALFVIKSIT